MTMCGSSKCLTGSGTRVLRRRRYWRAEGARVVQTHHQARRRADAAFRVETAAPPPHGRLPDALRVLQSNSPNRNRPAETAPPPALGSCQTAVLQTCGLVPPDDTRSLRRAFYSDRGLRLPTHGISWILPRLSVMHNALDSPDVRAAVSSDEAMRNRLCTSNGVLTSDPTREQICYARDSCDSGRGADRP